MKALRSMMSSISLRFLLVNVIFFGSLVSCGDTGLEDPEVTKTQSLDESCDGKKDCPKSNSYCDQEACGEPGTCAEARNIEECPQDGAETVCGCDGTTYDSACEAEVNGTSVKSTGPCDTCDECTGEGEVCNKCPEVSEKTCIDPLKTDYRCGTDEEQGPVCVTCLEDYDARQFPSPCEALKAGVPPGAWEKGACDTPPCGEDCNASEGKACVTCPENPEEFNACSPCAENEDLKPGPNCVPLPDDCDENTDNGTVCACGSDEQYDSKCQAVADGHIPAPNDSSCKTDPPSCTDSGQCDGPEEQCAFCIMSGGNPTKIRKGDRQCRSTENCDPNSGRVCSKCSDSEQGYANECEAQQNGVFATEPCPVEECDNPPCEGGCETNADCQNGPLGDLKYCQKGCSEEFGSCVLQLGSCFALRTDRVCGCDSQRYMNACLARRETGGVAEEGTTCEPPEGECEYPSDCADDEYCAKDSCSDSLGTCKKGPDTCGTDSSPLKSCICQDGLKPSFEQCIPEERDDCTEVPSFPRCGCDGRAYTSACEAREAGTSLSTEPFTGVCPLPFTY